MVLEAPVAAVWCHVGRGSGLTVRAFVAYGAAPLNAERMPLIVERRDSDQAVLLPVPLVEVVSADRGHDCEEFGVDGSLGAIPFAELEH